MRYKKPFFMKKAETMLEYAMVIGVATAVLFAMSTYAKRGTQAKVKDMTDVFISGGAQNHTSRVDDYTDTITNTGSTSNADSYLSMARGGETNTVYSDQSTIGSASHTEDRSSKGSSNPFQSAGRGRVDPPVYGNNTTEQQEAMEQMDCVNLTTRIGLRVADRDSALEDAAALEEQADADRLEAHNMTVDANNMWCPSRRRSRHGHRVCVDGRNRLYSGANSLRTNATSTDAEAATYRNRAVALNTTITNLRDQYNAQGCGS